MTIDIGFVGLSAGRSCAGVSHLPGLRSIEQSPYKITGVLNSSLESAAANIKANDLQDAKVYASIVTLVQADDINTVVVSVKVPDHYSLVTKALEADLAEAEEMVKLALEKRVKTGVGLQNRKSLTLIKAKELIGSDAIGRVISTNFKCQKAAFEYALLKKNGANFLTVTCGHNLDSIAFVLGEFEWLNGCLFRQFSESEYTKPVPSLDSDARKKVERTGETTQRDIDDQLLVQGQQTSNIAPAEDVILWEIHGTKGDIVITANISSAQVSLLSIKLSQLDEDGNATGLVDLTQPYNPFSGNLKEYYESFSKKESCARVSPQLQNSEGFPTFEDALIRHRQIQAIVDSCESGSRKSYI